MKLKVRRKKEVKPPKLKTRRKKEKESQRSSIAERLSLMNRKKPQLATDLQYLFDAMQKYSKRHWFRFSENSECTKCQEVMKYMISVGALRFCHKCFEEEFDSKAIERDKATYDKWYRIFEEKINMAFEDQDEYIIGEKNAKNKKK